MPPLIDQLIFTVEMIERLADGAISFKSKCWATRALARRVWEHLQYFKPYEAESADILETPLTQAEAVLEKAKEMTSEASKVGWLEEFWKMQQMDKKFHDLEMEFERVQIGMHSPTQQQICGGKINFVFTLMLA